MSKTVTVDIVADIVCPWCWLGKRYWDEAVKLTPDIKTNVTWRPFQLDASIAPQGKPYGEYMKAKFSGEHASRWQQMRDHLEAAAPGAGIHFDFDNIPIRPNTLNAHRIMRWATGQDRADAMIEALFEAFFAKGSDIGDPAVLAELAGNAGLDAKLTADLLAGDADRKQITEEEQFYRKLGVSGVPCYIFNGQFAVSGAQPAEELAKAIREAASMLISGPVSGPAPGPASG